MQTDRKQVYRRTYARTDAGTPSGVCELTRLKSLDSVLWSLRFLTGDLALSERGEDTWGWRGWVERWS